MTLFDLSARALRHKPLGLGRDCAVLRAEQVSGRNRLPARGAGRRTQRARARAEERTARGREVAAVEGIAKPSVVASLDRHERMFPPVRAPTLGRSDSLHKPNREPHDDRPHETPTTIEIAIITAPVEPSPRVERTIPITKPAIGKSMAAYHPPRMRRSVVCCHARPSQCRFRPDPSGSGYHPGGQ